MVFLFEEGYPVLTTKWYEYIRNLIWHFINNKYADVTRKDDMYDEAEKEVMKKLEKLEEKLGKTLDEIPLDVENNEEAKMVRSWIIQTTRLTLRTWYVYKYMHSYARYNIPENVFKKLLKNEKMTEEERDLVNSMYEYQPDRKMYVLRTEDLTDENSMKLIKIFAKIGYEPGVDAMRRLSKKEAEEGGEEPEPVERYPSKFSVEDYVLMNEESKEIREALKKIGLTDAQVAFLNLCFSSNNFTSEVSKFLNLPENRELRSELFERGAERDVYSQNVSYLYNKLIGKIRNNKEYLQNKGLI